MKRILRETVSVHEESKARDASSASLDAPSLSRGFSSSFQLFTVLNKIVMFDRRVFLTRSLSKTPCRFSIFLGNREKPKSSRP